MNYLWSATDIALRALESIIKSRIHVNGLEHLSGRPTLFIANHFTRFETFLIPYVHYKHTRRKVRCLADKNLFVGMLGTYLRQMEAWPTDDPGYKEQIVRDLATGTCPWVIYPEGSMVKTKRTVHEGQLFLETPYHSGRPRTGAAVFALKAEALRILGRLARDRGDQATLDGVLAALGIADPHLLSADPVVLHPVTITYYPLRPGTNLVDRAARFFAKRMPEDLEEELQVEGNLLLGGADIDIHFSEPLDLDLVVRKSWRFGRVLNPGATVDEFVDTVLEARREKIIIRAMEQVYRRTAINLDHLVAATLRRLETTCMDRQAFFQLCLLVALQLVDEQGLRHHPRLLMDLLEETTRGGNAAVQDVLDLAERTGVATRDNGKLCIDRAAFDHAHAFHTLRLRNPLAVIANELEPSLTTVGLLDVAIAMPPAERHRVLADALLHHDGLLLEREAALGRQPVDDLARPRLLGAPTPGSLGIVLSHGYLASPEEVADLGDYLAERGHLVWLPRLSGHGTHPERLREVAWADWLDDYLRGALQLSLRCERLVFAGFSAGGLLALLAATRRPCLGVVTINSPLELRDRRARYAPLVKAWNRGLRWLGAHRQLSWIDNSSTESPGLNYTRHPPHGVLELVRLMDATRSALGRVPCAVHAIQGDEDPVIVPQSATDICTGVGAERCTRHDLPATRHVIVRGDEAPAVWQLVAEQIDRLAAP